MAAAVDEVRAKGNEDRLYFATDVETALEPDHTICDEEPWLVQLDQGLPNGTSSTQEVVHPNAAGQRAVAAALLRWSARVDPPTAPDSAPTVHTDWFDDWFGWLGSAARGLDDTIGDAPRIDLDDLQPAGVPVQGGRPVTLQGSGFDPGAQVVVGIQSTPTTLAVLTADDDGRVEASVTMPAGLTGDHTVYALGYTADGEVLVLAQPVTIGDPPVWGALIMSLLAVLVAVGGWFLVRYARRLRRRRRPVG
jgi:hypothetical protein